jgi:uncharacterized protein (TIGR03437 family)
MSGEEEEMMKRPTAMLVLALGLVTSRAAGQSSAPSLLQIDVRNHTLYVFDSDPSRLATNPAKLTRQPPKTFESWIGIGDIVSVNGSPVKGNVFEHSMTITSSLNLTPGQAIADTQRSGIYEWSLDILRLDNTPLGLITIRGLAGGPPPPDAPKAIVRANYEVVGGTGVFAGVRGYYFSAIDAVNEVRVTSAAEDPAYRRTNGGGTVHLTLYLTPATPPRLNGFYHLDFSPVTAKSPALPGETIVAQAVGLGPVRPAVDPGQPFPADPLATVSSPVTLTVDDQPSEILKAVGWPGSADNYAVYFRMPSVASTGAGAARLGIAWMAGPPSQIPFGAKTTP